MRTHFSRGLLIAALVLGVRAAPSFADTVRFARGSLVIPEQSTYQSQCGATSAYGLIWRILQSNQVGHYNENHRITVYQIINPLKRSPNRCVPSNKHSPPSADPAWNDGCDFSIDNLTEQPVVPVTYGSWPVGGLYPHGVLNTYSPGGATALPVYGTRTLDNNGVGASRFTTINYLGGPFVIDARDAQNVIEFLARGDSFVPSSALSPFTTGAGGCGGLASSPNTAINHFVDMHQTTIQFTADVDRRANSTPPKIALVNHGSGVSTGLLDTYLNNAGLNLPGSGGCPVGGFASCNLNSGAPGLIYDQISANEDLISTSSYPNGLINALDGSGKPIYLILWAPHWSIQNTAYAQYVPNGDGSANQAQNVQNNLKFFAQRKGSGLMDECASIESMESGTGGASPSYSTATPSFVTTKGIFNSGLSIPGLTREARNCTDPDYTSGPCALFPQPYNPYSQIGDFHFNAGYGYTSSFQPDTRNGSAYQTGIDRLIVSWNNYRSSDILTSPPDPSNDGWDFVDFSFKDNDQNKGAVLYVSGHTYSTSVAGNRIILNTLSNLGYSPVGFERTLASPITYNDPNGSLSGGSQALLFNSIYDAITGYPTGSQVYDKTTASQWVFPYYPGDLRVHPIVGAGAISTGESNLDQFTLWNANSAMPLPHDRNLFTYFGGHLETNPANLPGGGASFGGVLQVGWVPELVDASRIVTPTHIGTPYPNSVCTDVMSLGRNTNGQLGLVYDTTFGGPGDGICDLDEGLAYSHLNPGNDFGGNGHAHNIAIMVSDVPAVQEMIQRVRGFCYAKDALNNPILEPTDGQCNDANDLNRAHVGGLVHSSPAVVGSSPYISDQGSPRPTVAYVGGWDGQMHAFYVSGGSGYQGPRATTFRGTGAASMFRTDWAAKFQAGTLPRAGTELWSYLPPSQLPALMSNNARVDSSPNIQDVFIDVSGSGVREWHTLLVSSVGGSGHTVFALDVTNPLKPVLLWDITGNWTAAAGQYASVMLNTDDTGISTAQAVKWNEATAFFRAFPQADPGRSITGVYNYTDLGGSIGLASGQMRAGLAPLYSVFAASSAGTPGTRGLELYSIDVSTGQKRWQWEENYIHTWSDNSIPPVASVLAGPNGATKLYAGDMDGRLWELDPVSGINLDTNTTGTCASPPCNYPAFDTQSTLVNPQPITSNIAIAMVPSTALPYPGATTVIFGTAGQDWVAASVGAKIHVLLSNDVYHRPYRSGGNSLGPYAISGAAYPQSLAASDSANLGALQELPPFPIVLPVGAHVYGTITVAGQKAYYETSLGPVGDIMQLSGTLQGASYSLDLGNPNATAAPLAGFHFATFGGIAVYHQANGATSTDYVIGAEVGKMAVTPINNPGTTGPSSPAINLRPAAILARFLSWMQGFMTCAGGGGCTW